MKYIKILEKEMLAVLEQLKPHFDKYGKLEINGSCIDLVRYTRNVSFENRYTIIKFHQDSIDNYYFRIYEDLPLNVDDVFEGIGCSLKEIKVKTAKQFDVNEWKNTFLKRHSDFCESDSYGNIYMKDGRKTIISAGNDVNFVGWHNAIFRGKSKKFKFSGWETIHLKTKDDYEEFERQFVIMKKHIEIVLKTPNLNDKCGE